MGALVQFRPSHERAAAIAPQPQQLDLFQTEDRTKGTLAFIDPCDVDGPYLLSLFARYAIKSVIDVRGDKSFSRSYPEHVLISDYMDLNKISYYGLDNDKSSFELDVRKSFVKALNASLGNGMTVIFHDALCDLSLYDLRSWCGGVAGFRAELNRRCL